MRIADILGDKGVEVHTALPWITVAEAAKRLTDAEVGALVVCDGERRIRGIVSERDIVLALGRRGAAVLEVTASGDDPPGAHVHPEESVARAMAQMTIGRHRHLPVVESGELMGMVSIGDLVKHRVREMEMETGVLRDRVIARG